MGKLIAISLTQLKNSIKEEIENIDEWDFEKIDLGEMFHKYKISNNKQTFFVKEIKVHEAQMEYFLLQLKLRHLPYTNFPALLEKNILVRKYMCGKMLNNKKIDLGLIKDFARMRNTLNSKIFFNKHNIFKLDNFSRKDNGFYERSLKKGFEFSPKR
jgi:hypothetical protein